MAEQIRNKAVFDQAVSAFMNRDFEQRISLFTEMNVAEYANDNNIWRSHHLTLEDGGIIDPMHR